MVFVHNPDDWSSLGVNRPRSGDGVLVTRRMMDQSSISRTRFEKMSLPVMMCLPLSVGGRFRFGPVTHLTCKHVDVRSQVA
jgi:hypothetical protein